MDCHLRITHYYHSGFSIALEHRLLLIIDYWRGEEDELAGDRGITAEEIRQYDQVFVLVSHEHIDHFDPVIYEWRSEVPDIQYIVSYDMPVGTRGKRMSPGERCQLTDEVTLTAYDSTDLGISFLMDFGGFTVFHAGDLNFWHWRDESTAQEIEEADEEFRKAILPLQDQKPDIVMFPVDPRQGSMYDAGANYYILTCKPRLMIPMHYFHRMDIALEFARHARSRSTEVMAMPGYGDTIAVDVTEDGYIDIRMIRQDGVDLTEPPQEEPPVREEYTGPEEENPFVDSDLPVTFEEDVDLFKEHPPEQGPGSLE